MTRVRQLWQGVGEFPDDLSGFTEAQAKFLRWVEVVWDNALWSARQAQTPTGLSKRGARRMMRALEDRGTLRIWMNKSSEGRR